MYLNQNYTGEYSRIEYGKKGDRVKLIELIGNMALVEGNGKRFHVKADKLSEKEVDAAEPEETIIENKRPERPRAGKKKVPAPKKQNELF